MAETGGEKGRMIATHLADANDSSAIAKLASPPGSKSHTPPVTTKPRAAIFNPTLDSTKLRHKPGSEPINPDALARALKDFEEAGRPRERTPGTSPSRKRQRVYGDR